jgi:hypothetical protein
MSDALLQQKLTAAENLITVLQKTNADLTRKLNAAVAATSAQVAVFDGEKAAMEATFTKEKEAMQAQIKDLKEALDICNGKHGGNWGGKPLIPGRMG